jgi:TPR repeat protein
MIRWKARFSGVPLAVAVLAGLAAPAWADYESALATLRSGGDVAAACKEMATLADQGDAAAMFSLSELYRNGTCGTKDAALARKWHRSAAENGDAYAQMTLGSNYRIGTEGLAKDYVLAYKWYALAASAAKPRSKAAPGETLAQLLTLAGTASFGDTAADLQAAAQRDRMAKKMTPAQIKKAKELVREWKPKTR